MHRNKHLLFISLFLLWTSMNFSAQQGNLAVGGEATGTGGNMSFFRRTNGLPLFQCQTRQPESPLSGNRIAA